MKTSKVTQKKSRSINKIHIGIELGRWKGEKTPHMLSNYSAIAPCMFVVWLKITYMQIKYANMQVSIFRPRMTHPSNGEIDVENKKMVLLYPHAST